MSTPVIDLDAIRKKAHEAVAGMTPEKLREEALKIRVRQKTQQKKQTHKGAQKEYMKRQNEQRKLILAKAAELGILDEINEQADAKADEQFESWKATQAETETEASDEEEGE